MRLIDADIVNPEDVFLGSSDFARDCRCGVERLLYAQPTVAPETLPIVKELRKQLEQARRDCAVAEKNHAECVEKIQLMQSKLDSIRKILPLPDLLKGV